MTTSRDGPRNPPRLLAELSGTVLEQRYEIGRVLGAGGMGAVFEGRHLRLDRPVAIKVLRPGLEGHDEYVARFLREAKAASKIRHRNVVEILDYGETSGGLVYSVMELLVGQDLEQLLCDQPEGRLPWAWACDLLVQIASGLKAAHGQGVIHRDIKPANCFLTDEDGEPVVKLVDFGIAKLEESEHVEQLTATAQVLGTPSYIAPELARTRSPASPRSDIYALGVLAYRMLTGRVPFTGDTAFEVLRRACFDPVPPLRAQVPELPPAVEELVLELLAKEPEERPADVLTVRQRLLVLSRDTLGPQAVEIPGSSALPLDVEMSGPAESDESTTKPREMGPRGDTARVELAEAEAATLELEDEQGRLGRRASRSPETATEVLAAPAGVPVQPIHDRSSLPSSPGETMPVIGEAGLQEGDSASIVRPRRSRVRWLALGGAAVLVAIGGVGLAGDRGDGAALEESAAISTIEVDAAEAGAGSVVVAGVVDAERSVVAEVKMVPEPPEPGDVTEPQPGPPVAPLRAEATEALGSASSGSLAPDEPESAMEEPPVSDMGVPQPTAPTDQAKKQRKPIKKASEQPGLPSDKELIAKLKRLINERCGTSLGIMKGARLSLSFVVTTTGTVRDLKSTPVNPAGDCAMLQVKDAEFRPRYTDENKSFIVN